MAVRVTLVAFGRMCPDLDALAGKRSTIAGTADGTAHPETAATNPVHDRRPGPIVVGAAAHRPRRRQPLCTGRDKETGCHGHRDGAAGREDVSAG